MDDSDLFSPDDSSEMKPLPGEHEQTEMVAGAHFPSSKSVENMESIQLESSQADDSVAHLDTELSDLFISANSSVGIDESVTGETGSDPRSPDPTSPTDPPQLFSTPIAPATGPATSGDDKTNVVLADYLARGDNMTQDVLDNIPQPSGTDGLNTEVQPLATANNLAPGQGSSGGVPTSASASGLTVKSASSPLQDCPSAQTTTTKEIQPQSVSSTAPGMPHHEGSPAVGVGVGEDALVRFENETDGQAGSSTAWASSSKRQQDALAAMNDRKRERQISHSEEIPVSFEEEKGDPSQLMNMAASTRNLFKYFSEEENEGNTSDPASDTRRFFDSFTVSETQQATPIVGDFVESPQSGDFAQAPLATPPVPIDSISPHPSPHPSLGHLSPSNSLPSSSLGIQLSSSTDLADDPFYEILKTSDSDRRHEAWLPCLATRAALQAAGAPVMADPNLLTRPQMHLLEGLQDPIRDCLLRFREELAAANRHTLTVNDVPQNEDGLRQLITAECFRAAIDLTGRLISQYKQQALGGEHTPYELQLWLVRLTLLMKQHLYQEMELEVATLGSLDQPDLYFDYYPSTYPGRKGCMVPFHLRLLVADLLVYLGKGPEALDKLHYNLAIVHQILTNLQEGLMEDGSPLTISEDSRRASVELWESRKVQLMYSITNCLLAMKDFPGSLETLDKLEILDVSRRAEMLCAKGRVYLQLGDLKQAASVFELAQAAFPTPLTPQARSKCLVNSGFVALAENRFEEAHDMFQEAVGQDPRNAAALNNMAVSAVYNGRLRDALRGLETLVTSNPDLYLHEGILFNLCTLYELESSQAQAKKLRLLNLAATHKGDGFNIACLKLSSGL